MKARLLVLPLVAAACSGAGSNPQAEAQIAARAGVLEAAAATITAEEMRSRIAYLASDELGGRATPSPGLELAARYLARAFEAAGLEPIAGGEGFIHRYPLGVLVRDTAAGGGAATPPALREVEVRAPNVVALLRGSDPVLRETYVVFSAHMDHVGIGVPDASGDSIYNGADDDASGTSALVEVAEAFAALPERPARSLIFLAVSGEEKGLLGSRHFVDHPPVPIRSIVANINLDMIGRNSPDSIAAVGLDYSSLGPLAQEVARAHAEELGLTVAPDLWPEERLFFRSDHFNFAAKEIPAIFFFAGLHEDYHRPSDEVERLDADKAARVTRLVFYLGHRIATDPEAPRWTER
ncbi:MAG TPA: M20/M25/M40 family metallo-hydrolase, partial [Longimicrobiales bacterium]